VESDECEVGPPLYESQTLVEAGVGQGQKVILEPGRPPLPSQVGISWQQLVGWVGMRAGGQGSVSKMVIYKLEYYVHICRQSFAFLQ